MTEPFNFCGSLRTMWFFFYFLVWVDTGSGCHTVNIRIGSGVSDTRQWRIKVTQYDCGIEEVTGPPGCLQYLTADSGTIQSFNFPTSETVPTSCKWEYIYHMDRQSYPWCIAQVLNSLWLKMKIFLQQPIYQIKTTTFALEGFQENVLFVIHRQLWMSLKHRSV